jgi:hypothetical protein
MPRQFKQFKCTNHQARIEADHTQYVSVVLNVQTDLHRDLASKELSRDGMYRSNRVLDLHTHATMYQTMSFGDEALPHYTLQLQEFSLQELRSARSFCVPHIANFIDQERTKVMLFLWIQKLSLAAPSQLA